MRKQCPAPNKDTLRWSERRSRNFCEHIGAIADFLEVSAEYLINGNIEGKLVENSEEDIRNERKAGRKITYSKVMDDKSVALVTELLETNDFINLIKDASTQIVF